VNQAEIKESSLVCDEFNDFIFDGLLINKTEIISFMIKNENPTEITLNQFEFFNFPDSKSSGSELISTDRDLFSNSLQINFLYFEPVEKYIGEGINRVYINNNEVANQVSGK
jgi:hypothetical protein